MDHGNSERLLPKRPTLGRSLVAMVSAAFVLALLPSGAEASGGPPADRTVRLQIASFRSERAALGFAATHQLAWNDCVLGHRLGVVPPDRASLPSHCTAQVELVLLDVVPAVVSGRPVYRVVTRPFPEEDLWGAVTAYRLAGIDAVVVK